MCSENGVAGSAPASGSVSGSDAASGTAGEDAASNSDVAAGVLSEGDDVADAGSDAESNNAAAASAQQQQQQLQQQQQQMQQQMQQMQLDATGTHVMMMHGGGIDMAAGMVGGPGQPMYPGGPPGVDPYLYLNNLAVGNQHPHPHLSAHAAYMSLPNNTLPNVGFSTTSGGNGANGAASGANNASGNGNGNGNVNGGGLGNGVGVGGFAGVQGGFYGNMQVQGLDGSGLIGVGGVGVGAAGGIMQHHGGNGGGGGGGGRGRNSHNNNNNNSLQHNGGGGGGGALQMVGGQSGGLGGGNGQGGAQGNSICKFYAQGHCARGDQCNYTHMQAGVAINGVGGGKQPQQQMMMAGGPMGPGLQQGGGRQRGQRDMYGAPKERYARGGNGRNGGQGGLQGQGQGQQPNMQGGGGGGGGRNRNGGGQGRNMSNNGGQQGGYGIYGQQNGGGSGRGPRMSHAQQAQHAHHMNSFNASMNMAAQAYGDPMMQMGVGVGGMGLGVVGGVVGVGGVLPPPGTLTAAELAAAGVGGVAGAAGANGADLKNGAAGGVAFDPATGQPLVGGGSGGGALPLLSALGSNPPGMGLPGVGVGVGVGAGVGPAGVAGADMSGVGVGVGVPAAHMMGFHPQLHGHGGVMHPAHAHGHGHGHPGMHPHHGHPHMHPHHPHAHAHQVHPAMHMHMGPPMMMGLDGNMHDGSGIAMNHGQRGGLGGVGVGGELFDMSMVPQQQQQQQQQTQQHQQGGGGGGGLHGSGNHHHNSHHHGGNHHGGGHHGHGHGRDHGGHHGHNNHHNNHHGHGNHGHHYGNHNNHHNNGGAGQQQQQQQGSSPMSDFLSKFTANSSAEELTGHIYLIAKDQYGCRLLQRMLDEQKPSICDLTYGEVFDHMNELMTDPFANYLCQKLIEHCNEAQRFTIIQKVAPDLVAISLNMHGTRAVQKLVESIRTPAEVELVTGALRSSVVTLIKDLNGNHVIQRCLHHLNSKDNQFIYDAVSRCCVSVATHKHGCCVLQRTIDYATPSQKRQLVQEIVSNALELVQDAFGNYVRTQCTHTRTYTRVFDEHGTNRMMVANLIGSTCFVLCMCV